MGTQDIYGIPSIISLLNYITHSEHQVILRQGHLCVSQQNELEEKKNVSHLQISFTVVLPH